MATYRAQQQPLKIYAPDAVEAVGGYRDALRHDPCAYCGAPSEQIDHIEARSLGGPNHWSNLTASCTRCNQRKGTHSLLGFMLARELWDERARIKAQILALGEL